MALSHFMRLFFKRKAHTRPWLVLRGRKSEFASVGVTVFQRAEGLVAEQKVFSITSGGPKAYDRK